jgi:hypothetical protein
MGAHERSTFRSCRLGAKGAAGLMDAAIPGFTLAGAKKVGRGEKPGTKKRESGAVQVR